MSIEHVTQPTINLYGCGGTGNNIARRFVKYEGNKESGLKFKVAFSDMSTANLTADMTQESLVLMEGGRGSGGKRDTNAEAVDALVQEILHQNKPADVNIVVHSSGGGSGSLIGPKLVRELIKRGQLVTVFIVGSCGDLKAIKNSIATLKTYDNYAASLDEPIVAAYRENGVAGTRSEVDEEIQNMIVTLAMFFNASHRELDMEDLRNFIRYQRVTDYRPAFVNLEFFFNQVNLPKQYRVFSAASLTTGTEDATLPFLVSYHPSGFMSPEMSKLVNTKLPIHLCTVNGVFADVLKRLEDLKTKHQDTDSVVQQKRISNDAEATDDGTVF